MYVFMYLWEHVGEKRREWLRFLVALVLIGPAVLSVVRR